MNNIPPYPSTFPATSTNFFAPFLTVQANFSEISDRLLYLEGERAAMSAQISLHESRINDLIERVEILEGRPLGVAGFSSFWVLLSGNTISFAGRGVSLDGADTYDIAYTSINMDSSNHVAGYGLPGFCYIHLGRIDGALAIRLSGDYASPAALAHSCIIGVCAIESLSPFIIGNGECSAGVYTGYMLGLSNAVGVSLPNNEVWGLQLNTNLRALPGVSWDVYISGINRWGSSAQIGIRGEDSRSLVYPGESFNATANGAWFEISTDSAGSAAIRNTSGSTRTLYGYPSRMHLPIVYRVAA